MTRLINFRIDNSRDKRLKREVLMSKGNQRPLTITQIIKEALDMRWERQGRIVICNKQEYNQETLRNKQHGKRNR